MPSLSDCSASLRSSCLSRYDRAMSVSYVALFASCLLVLLWSMVPNGTQTSGDSPLLRQIDWHRNMRAAKLAAVVSVDCQTMRDKFAAAFADFVACAGRHTLSVRVCTACASQQRAVFVSLADIHADIGGCRHQLLQQDDVEVIDRYAAHIRYLLDAYSCATCIDNTWHVRPRVVAVFEAHRSLHACLSNVSSLSDVCSRCRPQLLHLQQQVATVAAHHRHLAQQLCVDVRHVLNNTWRTWHARGCDKDEAHYPSVGAYTSLALAVLSVLIMLVLFYAVVVCRGRSLRATGLLASDSAPTDDYGAERQNIRRVRRPRLVRQAN